jgi:Apea-like HEPN
VEDGEAQSITELLTSASGQVLPASGREPWAYGWAFPDYRHSDRAALKGRQGPVTLSDIGIAAFEKAVTRLLKEQKIRDRWEAESFWGMLAAMVVSASERNDPNEFISGYVEALRTVGPTLVIHLIANAVWNQPPMSFGNAVLGDANMAFLNYVNESAGHRSKVSDELIARWLDREVQPRIDNDGVLPAAIACWTRGQDELARAESERQLRDTIDLTILLEHDLRAFEVYHRGGTNRPGVRGITLDRGAVERGLIDSAKIELVSSPLTVSPFGVRLGHSWFGAEPLPLGAMLAQQYLRDGVKSCFGMNPISSRVRVAARWFTDAHYTLDNDDAALALGVAMDAMLSGERALPGNAMADRFALLEPDPKQRRSLVTKYLKLYSVRSSVAHGGRSSKLDDPSFIDDYRAAVH